MAVKYLASRNDAEKPSAQGASAPTPRGMIFSQKTVADVERELHPQRVFVRQVIRNIWIGFMFGVLLLCVSAFLTYLGVWDALAQEWQGTMAAKGSLVVTSEYVKSDVYLNGKVVGQTPLEMQSVTAGDYMIKVQPKDNLNNFFVSTEIPVTISGRNATIVKVAPAPTDESTSYVIITSKDRSDTSKEPLLTILTEPKAVTVMADGRTLEDGTPLSVTSLSQGTKKISLQKEGYKTVELEIAINTKKSVTVTAKMYQYILKL